MANSVNSDETASLSFFSIAGAMAASATGVFGLAWTMRTSITSSNADLQLLLDAPIQTKIQIEGIEQRIDVEILYPGVSLVGLILVYGLLCGLAFWYIPWRRLDMFGGFLRTAAFVLACSAVLGSGLVAHGVEEKLDHIVRKVNELGSTARARKKTYVIEQTKRSLRKLMNNYARMKAETTAAMNPIALLMSRGYTLDRARNRVAAGMPCAGRDMAVFIGFLEADAERNPFGYEPINIADFEQLPIKKAGEYIMVFSGDKRKIWSDVETKANTLLRELAIFNGYQDPGKIGSRFGSLCRIMRHSREYCAMANKALDMSGVATPETRECFKLDWGVADISQQENRQ